MSDESDKIDARITRKGILVWCALIFFVMGWMFVLGILVGRGTAPIPVKAHPLEKELSELKTALLNKAESEAETNDRPREPQASQLAFYEALKKPPVKESYKPSPPTPPKKKPEPAVVQPTRIAPAAARPDPAPKIDKTAVQPTSVEKPDDRRAALSTSSAAQGGRYTIQIAAFKDAQSAERMVEQLRTKGYSGFFLRSEVPDKGTWFRVRVGGFEERAAAAEVLKRLNGDGFMGIVVGAQ